MLNTNIQIILKKSSSGLSALFHLIDLDLLCCISKLIPALGTWPTLISKLSNLQGKNAAYIWFNFNCIGLWLYMV